MADWNSRLIIKHLFVLNYKSSEKDLNKVIDIAVVTTDGKYVEYEFRITQNDLTFFTVSRFKSLFADFQFTPNSDVCFYDNIREKHPLYMFVSIIAQQMMFPIKWISADKIVGRIGSLFPHYLNKPVTPGHYKNVRKGCLRNIHLIWKRVIRNGRCPWITADYDAYLNTVAQKMRARKRLLRLGAWYQVLKTNQSAKVKKSAEKRKERLKSGIDGPEF